MTTERICSQILSKLKESKLTNYKVQSSIDILENHLKENQEYNREKYKEEIIKDAVESNCNKFKILAVIPQDTWNIFEWCDEAYNFGYALATSGQDKKCYNKREYTLNELNSVIDRALSWLESLQTTIPFYTIKITLFAIR